MFDVLSGVTATISGLTIEQGESGDGGGIDNSGALPSSDTVTNCSALDGGGLFNSGKATVSDSVSRITTPGSAGRSITSEAPGTCAKLSIDGDSFTDNTGYIGGGAIYDGTTTNTSLSHYSTSGRPSPGPTRSSPAIPQIATGAAFSWPAGRCRFPKDLFSRVHGSYAGGAIAVLGGQATIEGVTLNGNTAGTDGGAIETAGAVTLLDSTVALNSAGDGGGVANLTYGTATGTMTVTNATIYGNTAIGVGGGIENFGTLALTDTTVSGNTALYGGGIYNQGTVTLGNTIVAGDTATSTGPTLAAALPARATI